MNISSTRLTGLLINVNILINSTHSMKKSFLILVVILVAGFTQKLMAQVGTTNPTAAGAKIVTALTLTETSALHFGTMAIPTSAATVLVSTAGVRSIGSGTVTLLAQAPVATNAAYSVAGSIDATYTINLPGSATISSGLNNMTIDNFVALSTTVPSATTGKLNGSGTDTFKVGATLHLANAQAAGVYAGSFNVTVVYN